MAGFSSITYALAKSMARKTMQGGGAIKGDKGDKGDAGTIAINSVKTLPAGSEATVENVGTDSAAKLNIGIPQGETGDKGDTGAGVPNGGTTGQILTKKSNDDQDTEWTDPGEADLPAGGTTGQVLTKKSNDDGDVEWSTPAGSGDMLKSVYDTDNDGKVDSAENADTVNNHTVEKDVPSNAEFTDTVYDDTAITGRVSDIEDVIPNDATEQNQLATENDIPDITGKADVSTVIDSASYDSSTHKILFKKGNNTLFDLDAAAFVKDGMVDTVSVIGGNLVITFNTDAGKQAISIPLTDIFDPANYYDKTATDNLLADKVSKSNTAGLLKNDGTVDTNTYATTSQLPDITGKADKVSGATNGNFASLDANGNLTDSGKSASDFGTADEIAKKGDTLSYADSTLKLLSGETVLSEVTISAESTDLTGYATTEEIEKTCDLSLEEK